MTIEQLIELYRQCSRDHGYDEVSFAEFISWLQKRV